MSEPVPAPTALELVIKGREEEIVAYACPKCGIVVSTDGFFCGQEEARKAASDLAAHHCHKFCSCGSPIKGNYTRCPACALAADLKREEERFNKAEKVHEGSYEHAFLYWPNHGENGYFHTLEELLDYCEEELIELPAYVWACHPVPFKIDTESVLYQAFEDHYEGAVDALLPGAEEELQKFVDEWCKKQNIQSFEVDYSRAVILEPRELDWEKEQREDAEDEKAAPPQAEDLA